MRACALARMYAGMSAFQDNVGACLKFLSSDTTFKKLLFVYIQWNDNQCN